MLGTAFVYEHIPELNCINILLIKVSGYIAVTRLD